MSEMFNKEEVRLLEVIQSKIRSMKDYQEFVANYQKQIDELQVRIASITTSKDVYIGYVNGYEVELTELREKLKKCIGLSVIEPTLVSPILVSKDKSLPEDCVDQLEARSKVEPIHAKDKDKRRSR
jgi:IMP cyclohydrolase